MPIALNLIFMFFLASQAFSTFFKEGKMDKSPATLYMVLLPVFAQALFFLFGFLLGNRFIYLLNEFKTYVILGGFIIIGIRFLVDAFAVRKGKKTFKAVHILEISLASIAQATNTFLMGLLFSIFEINLIPSLSILALFTLFFSFAGSASLASKRNLALSSLLILLGGLFMVGASFYLAFNLN